MNLVKLDEFMVKRGGSVDPKKFSEEVFELFSIPAFDTGIPEIVKGSEIGSTKKCIEPNDVLLSKIVPHIRRCLVVPKIGKLRQIASGEWIQFRSEKLVPNYLKFFLISNTFHRQFMSTVKGVGGSLLRASPSQVANIEIPVPPLAEQQKIAAILDAADSPRQKDQQLVERYTALSQSLFLEMFGDPVTNPKSWNKEELGSLAKISSGSTPSRDVAENYDGKIPWVKTGEVNGTNIIRTSECISEEALANSSCKLYPSGSLIIAMYGQGKTRGNIGRLGIEAATNQACAVIPPSSKMNYDFLFSLLKLSYEDLRSLGRGGNQPNLNSGLIKAYSVISPPIVLQNQFAERIQLIEAQKQQAQRSLEKSEALFHSLLQRAFSGEFSCVDELKLVDDGGLYQSLLREGVIKIIRVNNDTSLSFDSPIKDVSVIEFGTVVSKTRIVTYTEFQPKLIIEKFKKYAKELISGKIFIFTGGSLGLAYLADDFANVFKSVTDFTRNPDLIGALGLFAMIVEAVDSITKSEFDDIAYVAVISVLYRTSFNNELLHNHVLKFIRDTGKGMSNYELNFEDFQPYLDKLHSCKLIQRTEKGNWYISETVTFEE